MGFLFACALATFAVIQFESLQTGLKEIDQCYRTLAQIDELHLSLTAMDSSERRYLLTGRTAARDDFREQESRVSQAVEDLARLSIDNTDEQADIARLRVLIPEALSRLSRAVSTRDAVGPLAAASVVRQGAGDQDLEELTRIVTRMKGRAAERMAERQDARQSAFQWTLLIITVGLAVYLVTFLVTYALIRRMLWARGVAEEAAFRARELAEITLQSIGDGVLVVDENGRITDLNPAAANLLGRALGSLRGTQVGEAFRLVHRYSRKPVENPLLRALRSNESVALASDAVLIRDDESEIDIEDSAAPIRTRTGEVIGGVIVFRDVTQSRALSDRVTFLALHDPLTGLGNRTQLEARLEAAIEMAQRREERVGLIYIDLDRFKPVNDELGHAAGDELLKEIAGRLGRCLRASDTACRVGGDEFVVVLPGIADAGALQRLVDKIILAANEPLEIAGRELTIGLSAGTALYPDDGTSSGAITRAADLRMYQAKAGNRSRQPASVATSG